MPRGHLRGVPRIARHAAGGRRCVMSALTPGDAVEAYAALLIAAPVPTKIATAAALGGAGDLIAHKFRGDLVGNAGPPRLARVLMLQTGLVESPGFFGHPGSPHVFADGNEFHFWCDNTLAGVIQLGHWVPL